LVDVREDDWILIHTAKVPGWTDDWKVSDRENAWLYATAAEQSHSAGWRVISLRYLKNGRCRDYWERALLTAVRRA
jgi:hypothetical protein